MDRPMPDVDTRLKPGATKLHGGVARPREIVSDDANHGSSDGDCRRDRGSLDLLRGHFPTESIREVDAFTDQHRLEGSLREGEEFRFALQRGHPMMLHGREVERT